MNYPSNEARFLEEAEGGLEETASQRARLQEVLNGNELALYCQPILALQGPARYPLAETLVRLREEEAALLPPGEFFPVFEHYGMMPSLDRWLVGRVVERLAGAAEIGRLTINVSTQTIEDRGFPKFVADQLVAMTVAPRRLVFEVSEADMIARLESAARFSASIKELGCCVLVDGFGAQGVTFAPLKQFRADYLKVDGSIVRNILRNPATQTKLTTILRVGKTIGVGIICEAVEEEAILAQLKALGADYAQGLGVHQPCPMAALLDEQGSA